MSFPWRIGVEVELMAPPGLSRRTQAERLATDVGGSVGPFFHPQSELSLVPGTAVFENRTIGFEVLGAAGELIVRCVDDLTLQDDLDQHCAPRPGWFRVVSDDLRLLHLVARVGRADPGPLEALAPVAALFGTQPELFPEGMVRFFERWGPDLRRRVGANAACRRLGGWPDELRRTVSVPGFEALDWQACKERLQAVGLSKYCDFNLKNLVHDVPGKPTFEVRILPGLVESAPILRNIELFETVLRQLLEAEPTENMGRKLLGML